MKLNLILSVLAQSLIVSSVYAECPRTEGGTIDFSSIPVLVSDSVADLKETSTKYFYNADTQLWNTVDSGSGYSIGMNDFLDVKSYGLCIDEGNRGTAVYMSLSIAAHPMAYVEASSGLSYITGLGPLPPTLGIPEDLNGFMAVSFVDTKNLSIGANIYSLIVQFSAAQNSVLKDVILNTGFPTKFLILKSAKTISSAAEFNKYVVTPTDSILLEFANNPGPLSEFSGLNTDTGEVTTKLGIEQPLTDFKKLTGIGTDSTVLSRITTYTIDSQSTSGRSIRIKAKGKFGKISKKSTLQDSIKGKKAKLK